MQCVRVKKIAVQLWGRKSPDNPGAIRRPFRRHSRITLQSKHKTCSTSHCRSSRRLGATLPPGYFATWHIATRTVGSWESPLASRVNQLAALATGPASTVRTLHLERRCPGSSNCMVPNRDIRENIPLWCWPNADVARKRFAPCATSPEYFSEVPHHHTAPSRGDSNSLVQ